MVVNIKEFYFEMKVGMVDLDVFSEGIVVIKLLKFLGWLLDVEIFIWGSIIVVVLLIWWNLCFV